MAGLVFIGTAFPSAIFLILEMNHPLEGIIQVSSASMRKAVELIGH